MRGVILAGGRGTRLEPSTNVTNKHLLCVYDRPMIHYPIQTLVDAGIGEIMVVSGRDHIGHMVQLLGSGSQFGAEFTYRAQDEAGGIAEALLLAERFANDDDIAVILGDNLFQDSFKLDIESFEHRGGAKVFLKEVPDPERFGIAEIKDDKVVGIAEKPMKPKSNLAVVGFYLYNFEVFSFIKRQDYSLRRQLEITDTNQTYIDEEEMEYRILDGYWSDMGTPCSLLKSANFLAGIEVGK